MWPHTINLNLMNFGHHDDDDDDGEDCDGNGAHGVLAWHRLPPALTFVGVPQVTRFEVVAI